jgi:hypothetical protein
LLFLINLVRRIKTVRFAIGTRRGSLPVGPTSTVKSLTRRGLRWMTRIRTENPMVKDSKADRVLVGTNPLESISAVRESLMIKEIERESVGQMIYSNQR